MNTDYYGLLSISDCVSQFNEVFYLSFDHDKSDENEKWEWKALPTMPNYVMSTMGCIVNRNLFVIGGYSVNCDPLRYTQSFNFDKKEWINLQYIPWPHARACAGICNDNDNKIYIGGGHTDYDIYSVPYYDINKNKWFCDIPNTNILHEDYPSMWIENGGDLLYIASITGNGIEYIDLRDNSRKWIIMYRKLDCVYQSLTSSLFNIYPTEIENHGCRLFHWSP